MVWGIGPDYLGDSGAFWAHALGETEKVGCSLIQRGAQFDKIQLVQQTLVTLEKIESLRTIKIKQVTALEKELPWWVKHFLTQPPQINASGKNCVCTIFRAPTLWTYISYIRRKQIDTPPLYAYKKESCYLSSHTL